MLHELGAAFNSARAELNSQLGRCRSMGQTKAAGPCSMLSVYQPAVCLTSPGEKTQPRGIQCPWAGSYRSVSATNNVWLQELAWEANE